MTPTERNLLIRVARRLEEYAATIPAELNEVQRKRRLDRELGDVREIREYIKRSCALVETTGPLGRDLFTARAPQSASEQTVASLAETK